MSLFDAYPVEYRKHRRLMMETRIMFLLAAFGFGWFGQYSHNIWLMGWGLLNAIVAGLM